MLRLRLGKIGLLPVTRKTRQASISALRASVEFSTTTPRHERPAGNRAYYGSKNVTTSFSRPEYIFYDMIQRGCLNVGSPYVRSLALVFRFWFFLDFPDQAESGVADVAAKRKGAISLAVGIRGRPEGGY